MTQLLRALCGKDSSSNLQPFDFDLAIVVRTEDPDSSGSIVARTN